jgi:hypothetical protein
VKFTPEAARRIAAVVRDAEAAPRDLQTTPPRSRISRRPPQLLFAVKCFKDGGAAGSSSTTCSWTYTAKLEAGFQLGTGLSPERLRYPNTPYETPNAGGVWGAGFFDKNGDFVLWDANEIPQTEMCDEGA